MKPEERKIKFEEIKRKEFERRPKDKPLTLVHIITSRFDDHPSLQRVAIQYMQLLEKYCKELNIRYIRANLTTGNYSRAKLQTYMAKFNTNDNVNGIIYDFPFTNSEKIDKFRKFINPEKDVAFYSEATHHHWYNNFGMKPPHLYIVDKLFNLHKDENITDKCISIITNPFHDSHKGLIPYQNIHHTNYIFTSSLNNYVYSYKSDIVISLMSNLDKVRFCDGTKRFRGEKLVIDFGYTPNYIGSVDKDFFSKNRVMYYDWNGELVDLYIYAIFHNLFSLK